MIENAAAHYMFERNGKSFVGFVRKGWNRELKTDTQRENAVRFAYATTVAGLLSIAYKAARSSALTIVIGATFQTIKHGKYTYFFDESLFTNINVVMQKYFAAEPFFIPAEMFAEDTFQHYTINPGLPDIAGAVNDKTALKYGLCSWLHAKSKSGVINLPILYKDLSELSGALVDPAELPEIYEALGFLSLDLWRWCSIPVLDISAASFADLQASKHSAPYYTTKTAYTQERTWRT